MWSNAHGVLIGDYIYSKAFIHMVNIKNIRILEELSSATNDISQGELMQLDALGNLDITLNKLKKISYFKTGRLFEASARTGGLLSKSSAMQLDYLGDCAKNLGILFQIRDDLLDYSIDKKIGKPNFQDLKEGKITYPFYYAYKKANLTQKKELKKALGKKSINQKTILTLIVKLNGIKKTNDNFVMNYFSKLFSKYIDLEGKAKSELFSITIDFIFNKRFCLTSEYSV